MELRTFFFNEHGCKIVISENTDVAITGARRNTVSEWIDVEIITVLIFILAVFLINDLGMRPKLEACYYTGRDKNSFCPDSIWELHFKDQRNPSEGAGELTFCN